MVRPRRGILSLGLLLIIIRSLAGFVLPSSTRYLIDDVLNKHQSGLLLPLTLAVVGATIIQGITSFSLTQLLSIEGQKLIAQLRGKVQEHIGRLPVTYFDSNKTGQLVSRIMSDVEGMRNLVGTGVIEFIGGLLTAGIGLFLALRISPMMTVVAVAVVVDVRLCPEQGVQDRAPHFSRTRENQCGGHRTADRIAGRRQGHQGISRRGSGSRRFRGRRAAAARQRQAQPHRHVADVAFGDGADGRGRRPHHVPRERMKFTRES